MIGYALSDLGFKVLVCDSDPQANCTNLYLRTKNVLSEDGGFVKFKTTLMGAIQEEDLSSIVTEIKENLYLLPSFNDFTMFPKYLEEKFKDSPNKRIKHFSTLLAPLKSEFDFIFIDVPPTIGAITDSALYASDFVVIVLQTQERSLQGAEVFAKYLQSLIDKYDANFDVLGILPVLMKNKGSVDELILEKAKETFGEENVFKTVVKNMERLKRFDITGITKEDMHDRRVHKLYKDISKEFIKRYEKETGETKLIEHAEQKLLEYTEVK